MAISSKALKVQQDKPSQKPGNQPKKGNQNMTPSDACMNENSSKTRSSPTITPASSLPSKPQVSPKLPTTVRPLVWSAIAAKKSEKSKDQISPSTTTSSQTSLKTTTPKPSGTPTPKEQSAEAEQKSQISNKSSQSPSPSTLSPINTTLTQPHQALNNFNSDEILEYLTSKCEELSSKSTAFKDSGSAWVVKAVKSKKDSKNGITTDDVVLNSLSAHVKRLNKKEQRDNQNNNRESSTSNSGGSKKEKDGKEEKEPKESKDVAPR